MVADQWKNLKQTISDRAAVAYTDDFRSGLDGWESRSNLTSSWAYDASGFVGLGRSRFSAPPWISTDYRFEFLGEIDKKGMGCAFRAEIWTTITRSSWWWCGRGRCRMCTWSATR